MARKRAVADARAVVIARSPDGLLPAHWPAVEDGIERAVALGVVIGMRQAAKVAQVSDGEWLPDGAQAILRREAKRLAKQLRKP